MRLRRDSNNVGTSAGLAGAPVSTTGTQSLRDVRCVQNLYTWSAAPNFTDQAGTLYSDFLILLNDLDTPNDGTATPCFANHCDWRIPTIGEVRPILLAASPDCPSSPCIDAIFGPTQASDYLSSSSVANDPGVAWEVTFTNGDVTYNDEPNAFYARAVRGGR